MMFFRMIAATAIVGLLCSTGSALSLWDIDFESDAVGATPADTGGGTHAGGGVYEFLPNDVDDSGSTVSILTQLNYTSGSATLPGNSAVITDTGDSTVPTIELVGNFDDILVPYVAYLDFDLLIASGTGTFWSVNMQALGSSTSIGSVSWNPSGNRITILGVAYTGAWAFDEVAQIRLVLDTVNDELSVFSNGGLIGTEPWTFTDFAAFPGGARTFQLQGGATSATTTLAIDNIRTSVIPEPASIVLCGLGLIGLVGLSGRRRK